MDSASTENIQLTDPGRNRQPGFPAFGAFSGALYDPARLFCISRRSSASALSDHFWRKYKYGLSWQITPTIMSEMLTAKIRKERHA